MTQAEGAKTELRVQMLNAVSNLPSEVRSAAATKICAQVAENPAIADAQCVLGFAPLGSEPDITPLLEALRAGGTAIALPRASAQTGQMELVQLTEPIAALPKDTMGVRVPASGANIPPEQVEVALIPGVAFDERGNRLGRGGGFYDRFLASASALNTIGICFDLQLLEQVPAEAHDIRVHHVSTEQRILADLQGK